VQYLVDNIKTKSLPEHCPGCLIVSVSSMHFSYWKTHSFANVRPLVAQTGS